MIKSRSTGDVALFAPQLSPSYGGVWQFCQWVSRWVGSKERLLLVAPSLLFEEMPREGWFAGSSIPFEKFRSSVTATAAYRILEEQLYGRIGGVRVPLYGKAAWRIKRRFFDGDVIEHALRKRLQQAGVGVLHIPLQCVPFRRLATYFPYVINPHDFQHEHFPEFFTAKELNYRRSVWYADQRKASAVVVHSRRTQADAIKYLGIPSERVFYAPYGPLDTFGEPDEAALHQAKKTLCIPDRFIFYPARSWPHKNHLALVDALHLLRQRGVRVNAVFTAVVDQQGDAIRERIAARGLRECVRILGRVSHQQMGALYRLCTMVVVPSLFEQNSGPMLEAIHVGKAVAVSRIDELVGTLDGAGELFDPRSVSEIAGAIERLWSSQAVLLEAEAKIRARRRRMSWEPFTDAYRRAYSYARANPVGTRDQT